MARCIWCLNPVAYYGTNTYIHHSKYRWECVFYTFLLYEVRVGNKNNKYAAPEKFYGRNLKLEILKGLYEDCSSLGKQPAKRLRREMYILS
jgi:hypothetical protein